MSRIRGTALTNFLLILWFCLTICCRESYADGPTESEIKVAFMYNFGQFVTWPSEKAMNSSFVIGVAWSDPFGSDLDNVLSGKQIRERPIVTKRFPDEKNSKHCHILYIGSNDQAQRAATFEYLRDAPVLTVGTGVEFARNGGMIGFYMKDNRIKLAVNLESARRAGLNISSKLLRVSNIVRE